MPWKLAHGDIPTNLRELAKSERPADATGEKIWNCLRSGDNFYEICQAVKLMLVIPWSIMMAEQAHGSMSAVRAFHKSFGADMCMARSLLHLLRPLLLPVQRDARLQRWLRLLAKLRRRVPQRASAQGEFLKDVSHCAHAGALPSVSGKERSSIQKQVVATHHSQFASLDLQARRQYGAKRDAAVATKKQDIQDEICQLEAQIQLYMERQHQERAVCGWQFRTTSFPFSSEDLAVLDAMWSGSDFTPSIVAAKREAICVPPRGPSEVRQKALQTSPPTDAIQMLVGKGPKWMRRVALARSMLTGAAFAIAFPEGPRYFLFAHATQSPTEAGFIELRVVGELPFHLDCVAHGEKRNHAWCFRVLWQGFVYSHVFREVPAESVRVHFHVYHTSGGYAYSDVRTAVALDDFWATASFELSLGARSDSGESSPAASSEVSGAHSCEEDLSSDSQRADSDSEGEAMETPAMRMPALSPWSEEEMSRAYDEAAALRLLWASDLATEQQQDFLVRPVCGQGAMKKYNRLCEGLRGEVATASGREFVQNFRPPLQTSVTYSTEKYTLSECRIMALEWCARMQYLRDVWEEAAFDDELATLGAWRLDTYKETRAFAELASSLSYASKGTEERVAQIREIVPS